MNKEEFIAKKAIIQEKIDTLKCEMMDLKQAYIDSNAPFPVGSKVCIINPPSKVGLLIIENAYIFQKGEDMLILKDT